MQKIHLSYAAAILGTLCLPVHAEEAKIAVHCSLAAAETSVIKVQDTETGEAYTCSMEAEIPAQEGHTYLIGVTDPPAGYIASLPQTLTLSAFCAVYEPEFYPVSVRIAGFDTYGGTSWAGKEITVQAGKKTIARWTLSSDRDGETVRLNDKEDGFRAGTEYSVSVDGEKSFAFTIPANGEQKDADLFFDVRGVRLRETVRTVLYDGRPCADTDFVLSDNTESHPAFAVHTDSEGRFTAILPQGTYTMRSDARPTGTYGLKEILLDTEKAETITAEGIPVKAQIKVLDSVSGEEVSGAVLSLRDSDGNILAQWQSQGSDSLEKIIIPEPGETYWISGTEASEGYICGMDAVIGIPRRQPEETPVWIWYEEPRPVIPAEEPPVTGEIIPEPAEETEDTQKETEPEEKEEEKEEEPQPQPVYMSAVYIPPQETSEIPVIEEAVRTPYFLVRVTEDNGRPLAGARMEVRDSEGGTVDSWISDGSDHRVENESVVCGGVYTVHQVSVPAGYEKNRTDLEFAMPDPMPDTAAILTVRSGRLSSGEETDMPAAGRKGIPPMVSFAGCGCLAGGALWLLLRQKPHTKKG